MLWFITTIVGDETWNRWRAVLPVVEFSFLLDMRFVACGCFTLRSRAHLGKPFSFWKVAHAGEGTLEKPVEHGFYGWIIRTLICIRVPRLVVFGLEDNVGKGSRQNRIVPSVEGLAREAWSWEVVCMIMCDALRCVCEPFLREWAPNRLMRHRGLLQLVRSYVPRSLLTEMLLTNFEWLNPRDCLIKTKQTASRKRCELFVISAQCFYVPP